MGFKLVNFCYFFVIFVSIELIPSESTVIYTNGDGLLDAYQGYGNYYPGIGAGYPFVDSMRKKCPLCDKSVRPYCSDKLFHDSCCCYQPSNPYDRLPYECQYADCNFLHANSCTEHRLISSCCCTNLFS